MFLGYVQNYMRCTYGMSNLRTKFIALICNTIWLNKTYGECVQRKLKTKMNSYILQDEDQSNSWTYVKIDTIKTKHVKPEQNFKTEQYYRGEEDVQKTINTVSSPL